MPRELQLDIKKNLFSVRLMGYRNRLPRVEAGSPLLHKCGNWERDLVNNIGGRWTVDLDDVRGPFQP